MNPFFLGTAQRRLFGLHTPAASRTGRSRAAVLCQPLGDEYIYAHRSMRQLALRLSLCGFHTLRFDYFGTGDSAGEECDADAAGLEADVGTAIETLRDLAATDKVTLIGLRAGANIAASVAAGSPGATEALILWDPILPEDACLKGVPHEVNGAGGGSPSPLLRELQTAGFSPDVKGLPSRSLILVTQGARLPGERSRVQGPAEMPIEILPAPCPWTESASMSGVIPVRVIQRIEEWLR